MWHDLQEQAVSCKVDSNIQVVRLAWVVTNGLQKVGLCAPKDISLCQLVWAGFPQGPI